MNYFIKNAELFNALITINIIILLKCVIKKRSVTYIQHSIIINRIIIFKTNL